jgi:hypothetical protein
MSAAVGLVNGREAQQQEGAIRLLGSGLDQRGAEPREGGAR